MNLTMMHCPIDENSLIPGKLHLTLFKSGSDFTRFFQAMTNPASGQLLLDAVLA
ncbi:hypothetical protein SAMN06298226_1671 [Nitrosovibrio sp. Nv4]|nr:hypothetical protein SAMN06298226_1671 [Nitrosovibrio sp. Nv4]